jgi:Copper type II ascorbate-dependent monooxygenase, N-terminal domain/Secretion system C-terminal sorting domain
MKIVFALLTLLSANLLHAQKTNWAQHIAPILYKNCTSCHNPKGAAPSSFLTYADVNTKGAAIKYNVANKIMPPWKADPKFVRHAYEKLLSANDIARIKNWADSGAISGDISQAPPVPVYTNSSQLGTPDLVVRMPTYTSPAASADIYRCFVLPTNLTTTKSITSFEVIPGNTSIVHHALVFYDTSNRVNILDAADPGPGYTNFGGTGSSSSVLIGAWAPGAEPIRFPAGFGMQLPVNAKIIIQMHYPAGTVGKVDSTLVNFKLTSNSVRQLLMTPVLNHETALINGPLSIAANSTKNFSAEFRLPLDVTLLSVAPHMHLIGRKMKVYGIMPNSDTLKMINIPEWDFHWQGGYWFKKLVKVPANTLLKADAFYDNTSANPHNPSNPPKLVVAGEATTNEMLLCYFLFTLYAPGDENIVIDATPLVNLDGTTNVTPISHKHKGSFHLFPNPIVSKINIAFSSITLIELPFSIYNEGGSLMYASIIAKGTSVKDVDLSFLAKGSYFLKCNGETVKFVK